MTTILLVYLVGNKIKEDKIGISIFKIFIGKKNIAMKSRSIIAINLFNGFILILRSSKNPNKKAE